MESTFSRLGIVVTAEESLSAAQDFGRLTEALAGIIALHPRVRQNRFSTSCCLTTHLRCPERVNNTNCHRKVAVLKINRRSWTGRNFIQTLLLNYSKTSFA
jgi:hypothetical protein